MSRPVILVVDDDPIIRHIMTRALRTTGDVIAVEDVANAKDAVRTRGAPTLAFVDLGLRGADGWTLVEWLRDRHRDVAVVVVSGDAPTPEGRGDVDAYIQKPFEPAQLRELVVRFSKTD